MDLPTGQGISRRDRVLAAIRQKPQMTELEIAKAVVPSNAYQQRVNSICRALIDDGHIERHGVGGSGDPFRYTIRKANA